MDLREKDLALLKKRNIHPKEITRQLSLFRNPPSSPDVVRPCTNNDGIVPMEQLDQDHLQQLFRREAAKGRFSRFVPASGAATRMFKDLFNSQKALAHWRKKGDCPDAPCQRQFFRELKRFAFYADLASEVLRMKQDPEALIRNRDLAPFVTAMLSEQGLNYGQTPKGLIPFHRYDDRSRTPLEEHLWETAGLLSSVCPKSRCHFTVSPAWKDRFARLAAETTRHIQAETGLQIHADFSCQSPETDTIAVTADNSPFRDRHGNLLFRPAGHGALISNLETTGFDLVLIKNIDNVLPQNKQETVNTWWQLVGGMLVLLESQIRERWLSLSRNGKEAVLEAAEYLEKMFGYRPPANTKTLASWVRNRLGRPLRVCGMVRNTGEPGGGPFWVRTELGTTRQIVELAQLDLSNPAVRKVLSLATHFNPVFMACALRHPDGQPFELNDYIDPQAIIMTEKSIEGQTVKVLERPGLWNGAMAGWNTLFVEVPEDIFQPVKTVYDLLRPAHQVCANP